MNATRRRTNHRRLSHRFAAVTGLIRWADGDRVIADDRREFLERLIGYGEAITDTTLVPLEKTLNRDRSTASAFSQ